MFINAGARLVCTSDGVCVIVLIHIYVQFSSVGAGMVWRGEGSSLHSGIESAWANGVADGERRVTLVLRPAPQGVSGFKFRVLGSLRCVGTLRGDT